MYHREWTTLTNTTPHRPKHSTINLLGERIKVAPLNLILSGELEGSTLEERHLLKFLFPDTILGFSIDEATGYLEQLGAFTRAATVVPGNPGEFFFHDAVRRQVNDEASMAGHLNHITKALQHRYPYLKSTREWSSQNCSNPVPGTHPRKPDLALCDASVLNIQVAGLLSSWSMVHSIIEIKDTKSAKAPTAIVDTIRNKALLIFDAQPTRRYLITAWITSIAFGLIYFDRSGEIRASWQSKSHAVFVRLIAGLAFGPESALGYDPSVTRDELGDAEEIRVKEKRYHIIRCLFKAVVLRGRGTACWLVEKDGQQFVIKDTWADVKRQWQEWEFLQACREHNIRNVAYLVDMEDIATDSTRLCRANIVGATEVEERVHRRLVLRPICVTIDRFASKVELLHALIDQIKGEHKSIQTFVTANIFL
jgi:hypothetical protein